MKDDNTGTVLHSNERAMELIFMLIGWGLDGLWWHGITLEQSETENDSAVFT